MQSVLRHRAFLRGLSRAQRRNWFEQFKTRKPRVPMGTLYLPPSVRRNFVRVVFA